MQFRELEKVKQINGARSRGAARCELLFVTAYYDTSPVTYDHGMGDLAQSARANGTRFRERTFGTCVKSHAVIICVFGKERVWARVFLVTCVFGPV